MRPTRMTTRDMRRPRPLSIEKPAIAMMQQDGVRSSRPDGCQVGADSEARGRRERHKTGRRTSRRYSADVNRGRRRGGSNLATHGRPARDTTKKSETRMAITTRVPISPLSIG